MNDNEYAVLGSILKNPTADISSLTDKDFPSKDGRLVWQAIAAMDRAGKPIDDLVLLRDYIRSHGNGTSLEAQTWVVEAITSIHAGACYEDYIRILKNDSLTRAIVTLSREIQAAEKGGTKGKDLLDLVERSVSQLALEPTGRKSSHISVVLRDMFDSVDKEKGYPTGFHAIDDMITGLAPMQLVIIAGRPSMGKTSFALNVVENLAMIHGVPVMVFSLEMSQKQVGMVMACSRAGISVKRFRRQDIDENEYSLASTACGELYNAPITICDDPVSLSDIRRQVRGWCRDHDGGVVLIDYLQLIRPDSGRRDNRTQEIGRISRGLKGLAKQFEMPVIALSQLNRSVESRDNHRPRMSDLRDSGEVEQDADVIMMLYRDEYYNSETDYPGTAEVIVAKQRVGDTGSIRLGFAKECMRFENPAVHCARID